MKVRDLIEKLKTVDPELDVIFCKESEYETVEDVEVEIRTYSDWSHRGKIYTGRAAELS